MNESQKVLKRRLYMKEYMRRRALKQKRKFPAKPRMNPALYKSDPHQNIIRFNYGRYLIEFD